eukprot:CAMPEP_0195529718 /NCGR_PEP_ID=MMETSP0794_2-20130614/32352_1 /TAXON_ID=515487 /ORGANISM="Stephanopyxis turris, Strain CCMP 815" /LENGTH=331 /DNA_ID=CAMNT_0040661073 /DNA_START=110 /DNA_END=1105 /DNA_ORIENTATION=-
MVACWEKKGKDATASLIPIATDNIHEAVTEWALDKTESEAKYGPISDWNTDDVTDMFELFHDKKGRCDSTCDNLGTFNEDISGWNTSLVTNMAAMFHGCSSFNQDISTWDTSRVTDMRLMFGKASSFNADISNWNVSSVKNMMLMFFMTESFNQTLCWDLGDDVDAYDIFLESAGSIESNCQSEPTEANNEAAEANNEAVESNNEAAESNNEAAESNNEINPTEGDAEMDEDLQEFNEKLEGTNETISYKNLQNAKSDSTISHFFFTVGGWMAIMGLIAYIFKKDEAEKKFPQFPSNQGYDPINAAGRDTGDYRQGGVELQPMSGYNNFRC